MSSAFENLTAKQKAFVIAYLQHFNAYRAAKEAGYRGNDKTLRVVGSENLAKPYIRRVIDNAMKDAGLTEERVRREISAIAFAGDMADFEPWLRGESTLRELRNSGVDTRLLTTASETESGNRSIRIQDRLKALELLVKLLGLGEEVRRIKGDTNAVLRLVFEKDDASE